MHVIDAAFVAKGIGKNTQHTASGLVRRSRDLTGDNKALVLVRAAQPHPDHGAGTGMPLLVVDLCCDVDERQVAHDDLLPGHGPDTRPRHTFVVLFQCHLSSGSIRPGDILAGHGLEACQRTIGKHVAPGFNELFGQPF